MTPRCLICESLAVLPKENANTAVMLIGTIESVIRGMSPARTPAPDVKPEEVYPSRLLQLLEQIGNGVSTAIAACSTITAFAQDVQKYQFSNYDYLCLRCGALFDQGASTDRFAPTPVILSSTAPPSAQLTPQPSAGPDDPAVLATD